MHGDKCFSRIGREKGNFWVHGVHKLDVFISTMVSNVPFLPATPPTHVYVCSERLFEELSQPMCGLHSSCEHTAVSKMDGHLFLHEANDQSGQMFDFCQSDW